MTQSWNHCWIKVGESKLLVRRVDPLVVYATPEYARLDAEPVRIPRCLARAVD